MYDNIQKYKYAIYNDGIEIEGFCNKDEKTINLAPSYEINGKIYNVTYIQSYAFYDNTNLHTVILPDTITKIADAAFKQCERLKTLKLSNSLKEISNDCFLWCKSLVEVTIPDNVTSLLSGCFNCCEKLKNIILPSGLKQIQNHVFCGCKSLEKIEIPDNVEEIGNYCFAGCTSLKDIHWPQQTETLNFGVFSSCNFNKFIIPQNIKKIEGHAFSHCQYLEYIIFSDNTKQADVLATEALSLKYIAIPDNFETSKWLVFHSVSGYKNLTISVSNKFNFDIFDEKEVDRIEVRDFSPVNKRDKAEYFKNVQELTAKGFSNAQINQIYKGYKKGMNLSTVHLHTSVETLREIVDKYSYKNSEYFELKLLLEKDPTINTICEVNQILTDTDNKPKIIKEENFIDL